MSNETPPDGPEVTVPLTFALTFNDYYDAMRTAWRLRWLRRVLLWCGYFLIAGLIALINSEDGRPERFIPLGTVVILFVASPRLSRWYAHRIWRHIPQAEAQIRMIFDEQGCHITTPAQQTSLHWSVITHYTVSSTSILMYHGPRHFHYLPRRVLTPDQQRVILDLLQRHVGHTKYVAPTAGFQPIMSDQQGNA